MASMDDSAPASESAPPQLLLPSRPASRTRGALLAIGLGALVVSVTWLFGHLPWVVAGFAQDGVAAPGGSSSEGLGGVRIVIPLMAGQINALVAFTAIGVAAATLLPLAFTALPRPVAVIVAALAVGLTTLILTTAARSAISDRAADAFAGDERVLDGLVVGVFGVTVAVGLLGCLGAAQIGLLPLPVAVIVGELPIWLGSFDGLGRDVQDGLHVAASLVLLTAAFVISVRRSSVWAVLWPAALAIIWIATPLGIMTSVFEARLRPAGNVDSQLGDVIDNGLEVFAASFWDAPRTWWPGVVAMGVGLGWILVRRLRPSVGGRVRRGLD